MSDKILQINFKFRSNSAEYETLCQSLAQTWAAIPGLRWKIWILNDREKEAGGVYLFESERAMTDFLGGPLVAQVKAHPALHDLSAKTFDVMADVTAVTRGPVAGAAVSAAA